MNETTTTRQRFHDVFGKSDTPDEFNKYHDDPDELAVGREECVMWFPDSVTLPLNIPIGEFQAVEDITHSETSDPDAHSLSGETVNLTTFHGAGKEHTVQSRFVSDVAEFTEQSVNPQIDTYIHPYYANYPVLIECLNGRVLIAPFIPEN